jgi:hypothetical protein
MGRSYIPQLTVCGRWSLGMVSVLLSRGRLAEQVLELALH